MSVNKDAALAAEIELMEKEIIYLKGRKRERAKKDTYCCYVRAEKIVHFMNRFTSTEFSDAYSYNQLRWI